MRYTTLSQHPTVRFPEGTTDVRGWEVRTAHDSEKVGKVHDLVLDDTGRFRYLEVDTGGFFSAKRVLLPLGLARVDEAEDVIWVPGMSKEQFKAIPEYTGELGSITDDYAGRIRRAYPSTVDDAHLFSAQRFYEPRLRTPTGNEREARVTRSEEELAIGKRAVEAGEVGVRKRVETERVSERLPVTREEVTVERRPVESGMAAGDVDIGEDEIRVPLMEEEVIAEKRVVPKEEVVIRKEATQEERVVEDAVRKERIEVEEHGRTTKGRSTRDRDEEKRR